jgi:hypothetical protein
MAQPPPPCVPGHGVGAGSGCGAVTDVLRAMPSEEPVYVAPAYAAGEVTRAGTTTGRLISAATIGRGPTGAGRGASVITGDGRGGVASATTAGGRGGGLRSGG